MSFKRFILLFIVVLNFFSLSSMANAPAHLRWMGFTDDEPQSQQNMVNLSGRSRSLSLLNYGTTKRITGFVDVVNIFCLDAQSGSVWYGYELRSDWQQSWKTFKNLIAPLVTSGHVKGFAIGDEPVWRGMSISELQTIANAIKADFPNTIVYVIEAQKPIIEGLNTFGETVNYNPVPAGIDWIGFDQYEAASTVKSNYQTYLYPKMNANQKAILIPQAFGSTGNPSKTLSQYDTERAAVAVDFYNWAATDTKIIGIIPWHWMTLDYNVDYLWEDGLYWEIGAREMPLTKAAWQSIGASIIANNVQPVLTPASLIQNFNSFTNDEPLPSTYEENPWAPSGMPASDFAFSTEQAASGTTSIKLKNISKFRYCWGTNERSSAKSRRMPGQRVKFFEFKFYIADEANVNLEILPSTIWDSPCTLRIAPWGLEFKGEANYEEIADINAILDNSWNKLKVKIDMGKPGLRDDSVVTVWLNDAEIYNSIFTAEDEIFFETVRFHRYSQSVIYLDDIGMWGEIGCGDWGFNEADINSDCKVDIVDFSEMAADWLKCTDPRVNGCIQGLN